MNIDKYKSAAVSASIRVAQLSLTIVAGTACAQDTNLFSYSGFGTIGATHASTREGDYVSSLYQASGAGKSHDWDLGVASKLGFQVNAQLTDQLSAVVQVISMARPNNTFGPRFEWANVQYAVTPDWKVRAGRIALPTFMVSDTRMVGYSNPWITAPVESYNLIPLTNLDGVDTSYKFKLGQANNTIQVYRGKTKVDIVQGSGAILSGIEASQIEGFNNSLEIGALTARIGYSQSNVKVTFAPGVSQTVKQKLVNVGALYDTGNWFTQAEYSRSKLPGILPVEKAFYVLGGYRLGSFTPFAMFSKVKPDDPNAPLSHDQHTTSLGVRWDAMKNTAVKVQADRVSLGKGNTGYFTNVRPALQGSTVNVVTFAVDYVF